MRSQPLTGNPLNPQIYNKITLVPLNTWTDAKRVEVIITLRNAEISLRNYNLMDGSLMNAKNDAVKSISRPQRAKHFIRSRRGTLLLIHQRYPPWNLLQGSERLQRTQNLQTSPQLNSNDSQQP